MGIVNTAIYIFGFVYMAKEVVYTLNGDYNQNFIMVLAMAIYLKLTNPSELTYWQESGKMKDFITATLWKRIKEYKNV